MLDFKRLLKNCNASVLKYTVASRLADETQILTDGPDSRKFTRIQERKRKAIFAAALEVFSKYGFRGSTLEQVASEAGISKQNILYYFDSKQAIFIELIQQLIDLWLDPLARLDPEGEPVEEILNYIRRKLDMSRNYARESRLFANEVLQGIPNIEHLMTGRLKDLVDEKAEVISGWSREGKIAEINSYELIFSIWATTQHYADFDAQIALIREGSRDEQFRRAESFLIALYRPMLEKPG